MVLDDFQKSWFFDDFTRFCHLHHLEESASHPLPLQEGVPQVEFLDASNAGSSFLLHRKDRGWIKNVAVAWTAETLRCKIACARKVLKSYVVYHSNLKTRVQSVPKACWRWKTRTPATHLHQAYGKKSIIAREVLQKPKMWRAPRAPSKKKSERHGGRERYFWVLKHPLGENSNKTE